MAAVLNRVGNGHFREYHEDGSIIELIDVGATAKKKGPGRRQYKWTWRIGDVVDHTSISAGDGIEYSQKELALKAAHIFLDKYRHRLTHPLEAEQTTENPPRPDEPQEFDADLIVTSVEEYKPSSDDTQQVFVTPDNDSPRHTYTKTEHRFTITQWRAMSRLVTAMDWLNRSLSECIAMGLTPVLYSVKSYIEIRTANDKLSCSFEVAGAGTEPIIVRVEAEEKLSDDVPPTGPEASR